MTRKNLSLLGAAVTCALLLSACTTVEEPKKPKVTVTKVTYQESRFDDLPVSDDGTWEPALAAFKQSCTAMRRDPKWMNVCSIAGATDPIGAQRFFLTHFTPWQVRLTTFEDGIPVSDKTTGLMTGYYEPLLQGSLKKEKQFQYPVHGTPDDLLIIDLAAMHPQLKGLRLRGKLEGRKVVPYDTRGVIQTRKDMDRWALAWVDDPIEAFFLQIQGSGRIQLRDGRYMRVGFADQNGYRYHGIGNWLVSKGYLKRHELSMQKISEWAKNNPSKVNEAMAQNPSYIFFAEREGSPELGPVGAQGVPLTAQASVAVDPKYWRMGTPFIVNVSQSRPDLAFTRPVIAQDTGGAIKGVIRFDYFWGFGKTAGEHAGRQRSKASSWVLVPNGLRPEDIVKKH